MERFVIIIAGPTCSGKTRLSQIIAQRLDTEIISADSRQIYKYLDIGTAKPSADELKKIKHHFIDYLEPDEYYNVSRYENESLAVIQNLIDKNKIPVVAGGSGLYIKAMVDGIFDSVDADEEYRVELLEQREKHGNEFLYEQLQKVDPESASKMLPQNWKRVIRALEVFHASGKKIHELQKEHKRETEYSFIQFGLNWSRDVLYKNIEARVDEMIDNGLIEETKNVLAKGFAPNINALNTVGYKEVIGFLNGELTYQRMIELIKRNTRRYAKRQFTWFRKDERIKWIDVLSIDDFESIADKIIEQVHGS